MISLLVLAAIHGSAAVAKAAASVVNCEDPTKSVKLEIVFANKNAVSPGKVTISIDEKSKSIDPKQISRFIRNANDFYILFKVPTRVGAHEIELNTRFDKKVAARSNGTITNKTQDERLNVTCRFP